MAKSYTKYKVLNTSLLSSRKIVFEETITEWRQAASFAQLTRQESLHFRQEPRKSSLVEFYVKEETKYNSTNPKSATQVIIENQLLVSANDTPQFTAFNHSYSL